MKNTAIKKPAGFFISRITVRNLISLPAIAVVLLAGFGCVSNPSQTSSAASENQPAAVSPTAAKLALKVVKVDSEETVGEDGKAANVVDGDPSTIWHTQWQDTNPVPPHEIVIELTPPATIKGFTYLPRQDDSVNGMIKGYEFYVSNDGQNFGSPVVKGEFADGKDLKTMPFTPQSCRFIKLKALSEINGEAWSSAAEIGVVPE